MTDPTSLLMLPLTLAAGAGVGLWFGRRSAAAGRVRAERDVQAQQARAAETLRAAQAKAAKDLHDARAAWQAEAIAAGEQQRAEITKLTRHLTEAYDELDRLRADAARRRPASDTGQGFAATLPLGDL